MLRKSIKQIRPVITSLAVVAFTLVFCCGLSLAQIKSGTITGKVSDPTGAVIPGATVTVVNQDTNVAVGTVTDQTGNFTVPYLAAGTYSVNVEKDAAGFAKYKATDLSVGTAQTVRLEVVMKVGSSGTVETVTASAIELQTTNATVGSTVDQKIIASVPNITHNAFSYAAMQAGVVPRSQFNDTQNTSSFGVGIDGRRQATAIQVNGGSAFSNDITLDGVSIQGSAWNESAVLPNQDSLQEVKTITNNYSAEYGRAQGVVIFTTKSGGNQFHGTGNFRLRNEALNANSYSNKTQGFARPAFKSKTFGGSLGGPIIKDKAFFFASYEGLRFGRAYDYLYTVPTPAEKKGDFTNTVVKLSNGSFAPINIYDPFNATYDATKKYYTHALLPRNLTTAAPGTLNPFGLKLLQAYPDPNRAADDATNQNNYYFRDNQSFKKDVFQSRYDYHTGKHYLYGTYGLQKGQILTPTPWGTANPYPSYKDFVGNTQKDDNYYFALGDTFVISPSVVVDARLGVNRIQADNLATASSSPIDFSQFGVPKYIQDINVLPNDYPQFNPGVASTGVGGITALINGTSLHKKERQTNIDGNGSLTWTRGRWTHKFGGTYRVMLSNYTDVDDSLQIQTSANYTRQITAADGSLPSGVSLSSDNNGLGMISMALGAGNLRVSPGYQLRLALAQKYYALYSQNDWRATDRLTLNIGLRWDVQPGPTERYNRMSSLDLNGTEPLFGTRGAIFFPGVNGNSRNLWKTDWKNFAPRLGFAYQVRNNFVVRGGYGLTYVPSNTGFNDGPGFYAVGMFTPAVASPQLYASNGVLTGRFNDASVNPLTLPVGADVKSPSLYGGFRRFPTDYKNGFVQQWNLFLERKVGTEWLFSAGYIGSHGRNLNVAYVNLNNPQLIDPAVLAGWRSSYIATGSNPGSQMVPNPWRLTTGRYGANGQAAPNASAGNLNNANMQRIETYWPYPLQGDSITLSDGVSDYNALQLQATRQFSKGLQVNASYTWSKQMAAGRYNAETNQNYGDGNNVSSAYWPNLRPEMKYLNRQLTTNDVPHRLSVNWVYDLPVGRGARFDTHVKALNAIVGGWQVGGSTVLQSGFVAPLRGLGATANSLNGLPDRVPGVSLEVPKALQKWYDGKTPVTLPSGRVITPCKDCFLKYNLDAFSARTVTQAGTSTVLPDVYWYGNAVSSYGDMRAPSTWFTNMSVRKGFTVREKYSLDLSAQFTNLFNHTNYRGASGRGTINTDMNSTVVSSNLTCTTSACKANQAANLKFGNILDNPTYTFGTYTKNAYDPRQIEMSLHFRF